ncbi:MAG: substrate-binding domain-containing protein [Lentisphaeria bacterium]|nr:substrate-binding domain-containing protein [Lentisphaeria bacterium]
MQENRFVYEKIINALIALICGEYPPGTKLPGVRDLAVRFRCNLHTVRKALSFLEEVGVVETRKRIGCFVLRDASFLVGRPQPRVQVVSRRRIGVLFHHRDDGEFSNRLLLMLEEEAGRRQLLLEFHIVNTYGECADALQAMKQNNCQAVILDGETPEQLDLLLAASPLPLIMSSNAALLAKHPQGALACYEPPELHFWFDRQLLNFQWRYFEALGFAHIAFCGRKSHPDPGMKERLGIYREHCRETGRPELAAAIGDDPAEAAELLRKWEPFRGGLAVIGYDDIAALQLELAASKLGWKLPEEMALFGVNNFEFGRHIDPPLSTVLFPYRCLARRKIERAIDFMEGRKEFRDFCLPRLEVLLRTSCGGKQRLSEARLHELLDGLGAVSAGDPQ